MIRLLLVCALALVIVACTEGREHGGEAAPAATASATAAPSASVAPAAAPEPRGDAARGKELAGRFECQRCHDGLAAIEPIADERHCTHCHQNVMDGKFRHKPDSERWQKNVAHLTAVPSLAAVGQRFRYDWLVGFLMDPHDLRPNLEPTMPRLALTREQARDLATFLLGDEREPRPAADLRQADAAAGRKLIEEKGCTTCHRMSGVPPLAGPEFPARETRPAVMLAPDLRYARERLDPASVVAWLLDPQKMKPGTLMPQTPMSEAEAQNIAAYVLTAELGPSPAPPVPTLPPVLERRVSYAEVAEKVLDVTCRHCHGDPDVALGDGGPGNTGGFGFKPRGLNLTRYEYVQAGYLDDHGERNSVFAKNKDGVPRLVAAMMARHKEVAGKPDPEVRGMPLGLPPVPIEDIQLVATWVAQGRPR